MLGVLDVSQRLCDDNESVLVCLEKPEGRGQQGIIAVAYNTPEGRSQ